MKRKGLLVVLGLLAVLAFALATLPAAVLSGQLGRVGLAATGLEGSIWSGTAQGLAWRDAPVGDLAWTITPGKLIRGRLAGHLQLRRIDGSVETDYSVTLSGRDLSLSELEFTLPIEALAAYPLGLPRGWRGRAVGAFDLVQVTDRWPAALRGTLDIDDLVAPSPRRVALGSFHVVLPHPSPQASLSIPQDARNVTAQVQDKGGPLAVAAQLTLNPARDYSLEGTLAPRGTLPADLERSLQMLGPADAAGRRQFSVGGAL